MKNTTEEKREAIPNSVSRMLLAGIGVLLQVLWIFWLALKLNDYSTAIQVCTSVLTFLITLRIYGLHINSAYKISWIILILLFPIFGLTIYLLFGRSGAVSVMRRRFGKNMTMLRRYHAPILQHRRALPYPDRITRNHARYLQDRAGYPAYDNTDVTFYGDTCEALEAIDADDAVLLREELGDVLMQVVFHAAMEEERGRFTFEDVCRNVCEKLVFRHPNIFASSAAENAGINGWDALKNKEKGRTTLADELATVPATLPALMRAQKLQKRAAGHGLGQQDAAAAQHRLEAAVQAFGKAEDTAKQEAAGQLLFAAVNAARLAGVDAEEALTFASKRFAQQCLEQEQSGTQVE